MTIYILHGWAVDQENDKKWQPLIDALQKNGLTVIFLGIPGLTSPLDEAWGLHNYVEWLDSQLPKHRSAVLLGHSFGGQIAVRYIRHHPQKVAKLILIDGAGIRDHSPKAVVKRTVFWWLAKIGKIFFRTDFARRILYRLARERDYVNAPPLLRRSMSSILDDEVVDDLKHIHIPTLIIWGSRDKVTPLKQAHFFHRGIDGSQLQVIPEARHSPQFTHVNEVVAAIKQFLC